MRKLLLTGAIATLAVGLLATSASASFDHHFSVITKPVSGRFVGDTFRFKDKLVQPGNRSNRVGRDKGKCRQASHGKLRCHSVVHLNGEIGGFGDIRTAGNVGGRDNRVNVVGGTDDFNGVAGKMVIHSLGGPDRLHFDLVR